MTCCKKPSVANMDHVKAVPSEKGFWDTTQMVNRCCTHCYKHWYGPTENVKEYTRKEWDAWIASA